MTCDYDCYCGCDTRANRLKFLTFGLLLGAYLGIGQYVGSQQRACLNAVPEECRKYYPMGWSDVWKYITHPDAVPEQHRHVPDECIKDLAEFQTCIQDDMATPLHTGLSVLSLVLSVAMFVPLGMLCCCTKNPHKPQDAPSPVLAPLIETPPPNAPFASIPQAATIPQAAPRPIRQV